MKKSSAKVSKLPTSAQFDRRLRAKDKLDGIAAALCALRDTQWYSLNPASRAVYQSIRNEIREIWQSTENFECQKILAVVEAALGNPDGEVDTPALESVLFDLIETASGSLASEAA